MLEPKSNYVRNKIRGLRFTGKNRKYIRKLLALEKVVLMEPLTMSFAESIGICFETGDNSMLHPKVWHEKDYKEILKELSPEGHRKLLKELRMEREEQKRSDDLVKEQQKKNTEEDKLMWKKFGGRLK